MDDITQQMKLVALSGNANMSDANEFNAGLFKYLLFVSKNAGTKNIWSDADKDLKAWMRKQNKEFLRLMTCDIFYYRYKIASVSGNTPPGDANPLCVRRREEKFPPPLCQTRVDERACLCRHCHPNLTNA
jgi:hypothetical protein